MNTYQTRPVRFWQATENEAIDGNAAVVAMVTDDADGVLLQVLAASAGGGWDDGDVDWDTVDM